VKELGCEKICLAVWHFFGINTQFWHQFGINLTAVNDFVVDGNVEK